LNQLRSTEQSETVEVLVPRHTRKSIERQDVRVPITVHVRDGCGFEGVASRRMDDMLPTEIALPGRVLMPRQHIPEERRTDDVEVAVAVDVSGRSRLRKGGRFKHDVGCTEIPPAVQILVPSNLATPSSEDYVEVGIAIEIGGGDRPVSAVDADIHRPGGTKRRVAIPVLVPSDPAVVERGHDVEVAVAIDVGSKNLPVVVGVSRDRLSWRERHVRRVCTGRKPKEDDDAHGRQRGEVRTKATTGSVPVAWLPVRRADHARPPHVRPSCR
jgi:hypothetical protein